MKRYDPTCVEVCDNRRCESVSDTRVHTKDSTNDRHPGRERQSRVHRTQIQAPDVRETLPTITAAHDDHDAPDQVGGMVASRRWRVAISFNEGPFQAPTGSTTERGIQTGYIERPQVIECRQTIPPSENIDLAAIQHRCMRTSRCRMQRIRIWGQRLRLGRKGRGKPSSGGRV